MMLMADNVPPPAAYGKDEDNNQNNYKKRRNIDHSLVDEDKDTSVSMPIGPTSLSHHATALHADNDIVNDNERSGGVDLPVEFSPPPTKKSRRRFQRRNSKTSTMLQLNQRDVFAATIGKIDDDDDDDDNNKTSYKIGATISASTKRTEVDKEWGEDLVKDKIQYESKHEDKSVNK